MSLIIAPQFTQRNYSWTNWKTIATTKNLIHQYEEDNGKYVIWGYDGPEVYITTIWTGVVPYAVIAAGYTQEINDTDKADFEAGLKLTANKEIGVQKPFADAIGYRVRLQGYHGTAIAGQTTDIDYIFSATRYLNGMRMILGGQAVGDTATVQIVDKNGVYYPAGTVLDEFATNWCVIPDQASQGDIQFSYSARILAGLCLRLKYTSTGLLPVDVHLNMYTHMKT